MEKKNKLCPQYETNLLDDTDDRDKSQILSQTIAILEKQIDANRINMKQLEEQLIHLKIKYTYNKTGELMTELSEQAEESVQKQAAFIQQSYNTFYIRNTEINANIQDLKQYFLNHIIDSSMREIYDQIEEKGLSILKAQEMERSRIACDLHDSIVQNLANLVHRTELCIKMVDRDTISAKLDLQLVMQNIKGVINDIRGIIFNLKPMALEDLGLEIAIKRFLEQFEQTHKLHVNFNCRCKDINLETSVISITLFRIIQEACSNAVKHGHAKVIDVDLYNDETSIYLNIKDNGDGFDLQSVNRGIKKDNSGYGLSIMKERICLLSGSVHIKSRENEGTVINVIVPIQC